MSELTSSITAHNLAHPCGKALTIYLGALGFFCIGGVCCQSSVLLHGSALMSTELCKPADMQVVHPSAHWPHRLDERRLTSNQYLCKLLRLIEATLHRPHCRLCHDMIFFGKSCSRSRP